MVANTSTKNPHTYAYGRVNEQNLIKSLTSELIDSWGIEAYYLPRYNGNLDDLFGEDPLSYYPLAWPFMMYIENYQDWHGLEAVRQFGLVYDQSLDVAISQSKWAQIRFDKLHLPTGQMLQLANSAFLDEDLNGLTILSDYPGLPVRPMEQDVVYIPTLDVFLRVAHNNPDKQFFPLGALTVYSIKLTMWDYASERINTGHDDIDRVEDRYSLDILDDALQYANGDIFLTASNTALLPPQSNVEIQSDFASNETIEQEAIPVIRKQSSKDPRAGSVWEF